jgi:L-ascorbate metabolism protein UlaG (beta-lactamase superfamily)
MSRERFGKAWRWGLYLFGASTAVFLLGSIFLVFDGYQAFGRGARGARLARMQTSAQWNDGIFENAQELYNDYRGMWSAVTNKSPDAAPLGLLAVARAPQIAAPPSTGLRVTWLGHSTLLIEVDGHTFLTDPVWGERTSPYTWAGPKRFYDPPLRLESLPRLDAVLLSHDHYDHLDHPTIVRLARLDTQFIAPLGVGEHLAYWGVPESKIREYDWWDEVLIGRVTVACVPARHASGRFLWDKDKTLWAGYALVGPEHRVYFSGDTGLFPDMTKIGERYGPFDLTLIEAGAYNQAWPDWHLGPEQAVRAHRLVQGKVLLPIHWGLFDLASHAWTEPMERVLIAAAKANVTVLAPRPGQSVEPLAPPPLERWWPQLPVHTADEDPVRATKIPADLP